MQNSGVKIAGNIAPIFAPVKTPDNIVKILSKAVKEVCSDQSFISRMDTLGIPVKYMDDEEIEIHLKNLTELFKKILESAK